MSPPPASSPSTTSSSSSSSLTTPSSSSSYSSFFNKTNLHIAGEALIIGGISYYFYSKCSSLQSEIKSLQDELVKTNLRLDKVEKFLEYVFAEREAQPSPPPPQQPRPQPRPQSSLSSSPSSSSTNTNKPSSSSSSRPPQQQPQPKSIQDKVTEPSLPPSKDLIAFDDEGENDDLDHIIEDELSKPDA